MRKRGTINSWNPSKNCGTIICRDEHPITRYFFLGYRVIAGPEPTIEAPVLFDIDTKRQPGPGQYPFATNIEVLEVAQ